MLLPITLYVGKMKKKKIIINHQHHHYNLTPQKKIIGFAKTVYSLNII